MSKHDPTKKQRLKSFDFSKEGHAMHLVADWQGGPANGEPVIMTKATNQLSYEQIAKAADVVVELSMEDFLRRFFGLWYEDAAKLAALLGYETEDEDDRWEWKPLDEKIMEFTDSVTLVQKAFAKEDLLDENKLKLLKFQESIEKSLINASNQKSSSMEEADTITADEGINKSKEEVKDMAETNVDKQVETITKAQLDEMISKALEAQKEETASLKKALDDEKQARKEEKETILKAELKKSVSGVASLSDETKVAVEDFLFKARSIEGATIIIKALNELQENVTKSVTKEEGVETHLESVEGDDGDALFKAVLAMNTKAE